VEQAVYRVVQESLANVARHSQASAAEVCLRYSAEALHVTISDNGVGFETSRNGHGLGLRSIRERVGSLHGTFQVRSSPNQGTELQVQVPLKGHPA
jgi:signal transduction histidine kinase